MVQNSKEKNQVQEMIKIFSFFKQQLSKNTYKIRKVIIHDKL